MEPTATAEAIPAAINDPVQEIQDFDRVVERYWPRILRYVLAAVQDSDVAETLTQDCFWKAYRNRASFRGESSLNTWLMHIAVNLVRDHTRSRRFQFWKKAKQTAVDSQTTHEWLPDRSMSPEQRTSINQQVQAVWVATKDLSERQRTVFVLRFVEDMNPGEIAEATGMSESAVNVHLFRAVRAIRKRLKEPPKL
jgi:RNA polymerase sigma-70 factor (ECF subfamily)